MENKNQVATVQKITPNFVQKSMESIDSAMQYANLLLKSKLVPNHFYDKKKEENRTVPDYDKGHPEAIVLVLQHGLEIGLSVTQSLQQIVPVNGLISIKGDGAKSLILTSGLCEIWSEKEEGKLEDSSYVYEIHSKRRDGKEKRTRFSIKDALRAGLYFTEEQLKEMEAKGENQRNRAYAYKYSPWYKYPTRMIMYRCIGFISRDLYPDVLLGMVTTEEALDYPQPEGTTEIITTEGKKIRMLDSKHEELIDKSKQISQSVIDNIDKGNGEREISVTPPEIPKSEEWANETTLTELGSKIYGFAATVLPPAKLKILESLPGKKSNKRYREALLAFNEGKLDEWLSDAFKSNESDSDAPVTNIPTQENKSVQTESNTPQTDSIDTLLADKPGLVKQKEDEKSAGEIPKIFELDERGEREFENVYRIVVFLNKIGINDSNIRSQVKDFNFEDLEEYVRKSPVDEIQGLIQKNL